MGRQVGYVTTSVLAASLSLFACSPKYPKCENDGDCKEKGEVCVNGMCQECRDDTQCAAKYPDESRECMNGRCDQKPECRTDTDCGSVGEGLVCRSEKCVPECTATTDCASGSICENQRCVAKPCADDLSCGPGQRCIDGTCQRDDGYSNVSAQCRPMSGSGSDIVALDVVTFDFDRYDLTVNARNALQQGVECLKQVPNVSVLIEGHCDERGTQEYNLALGEKRANTVRTYMKNLGIATARMATRSKGENEPVCTSSSDDCWARNRRVTFIQKAAD